MKFTPEPKKIETLLKSGKKFIIPRFQREYAWEKKELKEYLEDTINSLKMVNGQLAVSDYFLGNIVLVGEFETDKSKEMKVVDGQQRITTITILLSVLSKLFTVLNEAILQKNVFKYIMGEDNDGKEFAVLKNETPNPFFAKLVQKIDSDGAEPYTEEQDRVAFAYDYFQLELSEIKLKQRLMKKYDSKLVNNISYVDLLKIVRDQVLHSVVVAISTPNENQANMIFEILNSKGKGLNSLDLIKNNIFEILKEEEPIDEAKGYWKNIISNLTSESVRVDMSVFFRHYWNSKYANSSEAKLHNSFLNKVEKKDKEYLKLLKELEKESKIYFNILNPNIQFYDNKKQMFYLVEAMYAIHNIFNISQSRVLFLGLHSAYTSEKITGKQLKLITKTLENFHFSFNSIGSGRPSAIGSAFSKLSIELRSKSKEDLTLIIDKFIIDLKKKMPTYEVFKNRFTKLQFSAIDDLPGNTLTKYVVNKIENQLASRDKNEDFGSVEHIVPGGSHESSLNIGNLVLLEIELNSKAGNLIYDSKKQFYLESNYKSIKDLLLKHKSFSPDSITARAENLCEFYYTKILELTI